MNRQNLDLLLGAAGLAGLVVSLGLLFGWPVATLVVSLALIALALVV